MRNTRPRFVLGELRSYTSRDVASQRDYYEILGVSPGASDDEIKRAYRKVAIELHPDKNPGDTAAEERFKEASHAYSVLSDTEKRRRYDRMGHGAFTGASEAGGGFDPMDFDAFSEMIGGLFGDMFRKKGKRARDLKYDLTISFQEAALGCEKVIEVTRNVTCEKCKGSGSAPGHTANVCTTCRGRGEVRYQKGLLPATRPCGTCGGSGKQITHPCEQCKGEGVAPRREQLTVTIPAGVEDKSVRSVRGGGEQTAQGQGDLHVYVHVEEHPLFTRQGADILCTVPVTYPQAVLGDQLEVPTLEGIVKMRLPPGTESNKVFRLRGKGMPVFGGVGKGDQLVKVVVEIPQEVGKRQRELLEELAKEMGDNGMSERRRFLDKLRALFQ
jgi:molecular chaperone DnaJ